MRNTDVVAHKQNQLGGGIIHGPFRTISSYLKIVSSGASSAVSAASSIVDKDDQVIWAGFDKLEREDDKTRRLLLLGYPSGFQVWDVEEADNVHVLVSKYDATVSFMQMLPRPIAYKKTEDKFSDSRPLLVVCSGRTSLSGACNIQDELSGPKNGSIPNFHDPGNSMVRFYSLRSHSYVHMLKFRSVLYSVRCSSRVIAVALTAQIHCFNTTTLEREYTILTNSIVTGCPGSVGYGPLAVGPRWLAYSGSPIVVPNTGRVDPQHLTPSVRFSNGVTHYAKESSKQLATGVLTIGDAGYKKLSRYCSDLLLESNLSVQGDGAIDEHMSDGNNVGMVIVRDIVSKVVIAQFRAHKSPISALCFDPSGTLLVTASVHGHNINVFKLMPDISTVFDASSSYIQLYRLQRGFTNAVIHDISFSYDSNWIMISSSRGTSHLFAINPRGGPPDTNLKTPTQLKNYSTSPPITLSAIRRIRNGTGKMNSLSGAIASTFHNCKVDGGSYSINASLKPNYKLLVFSPTGSMVQYALQMSSGLYSGLMVEAIQKWNICQKQTRREREDNFDIYGESGNLDRSKIYPEEMEGNDIFFKSKVTKMNPDEKHHLYISEAELQMYQPRVPLWVKPEFYFQSILREGMKTGEVDSLRGEFEIETIQTRMIEARSKDLVPVFDYLQGFKLKQENQRIFAVHSTNGQQRPENSSFSRMSSSGSLDSILQNDTELYNESGETERDSYQASMKANG